ncbi:MAG: hypothetical protein RIR55_1755 [Bacteroidota bacterium]|jgi:uncharacterized protein (TIGR00661 family)
MEQKTVCIAPLDWGLGHATRCIPLIHALEALNYTIYIAGEGKQASILKDAFPNAHFIPLKGYRIHYAKEKRFLIPTILFQVPKMIISIIREHQWLKKESNQYPFDLIISDNRFGFFHNKIKSVFITHQLEIQTPFNWLTRICQNISYRFINKFNACWVADMQPPNHIAGNLVNTKRLPVIDIWYMNCLSRLQDFVQTNNNENKIKFLGIVSGPEPQRAIFETLLWNSGNELNYPFVIVAGMPDDKLYNKVTSKGTLYHHLSGKALANQINDAEFIICRGGYTTLLELIPFKKKMILIPTPGQTEQEYLAKYWHEKKWAISFEQENFNLLDALKAAKTFEYQTPTFLSFNQEALASELKRLSL